MIVAMKIRDIFEHLHSTEGFVVLYTASYNNLLRFLGKLLFPFNSIKLYWIYAVGRHLKSYQNDMLFGFFIYRFDLQPMLC